MLNYLNNNLSLIDEYERLYKEDININSLIEKFRTEELIVHNGFDYGRFRIFIDSCMLLLNKEKLNDYYKNKYSFREFFQKLKDDKELESYLKFVKNEQFTSNISGEHLYYSLEGKKKTPWDQVATIRNSMAHMQYGHFSSLESGLMIYYLLYNKDKGVRKDCGIVFEHTLHKFIHCFFSNYSYGLLFKYSFFLKYSLKRRRKTRNFIFYEITSKNEGIEVYNGYNSNLMRKLADLSNDYEKIISFILENKEKLNINEICINEYFNIQSYKKLARRFKLYSKEEYYYGLKTFFDFETELSNFLVHMSHLNEILYQYCVMRDSGIYTLGAMREYKKQLEKKMIELKEDENGRIAFEVGFVYLRLMNFSLRTEDDDYIKLEYTDINVDMFNFDNKAFGKYVTDNNIKECQLQKYIVERIRNALMHGHIGISLNKKGEVIFIFTDIYNNRNEKIEISIKDLKIFLAQKCLYYRVPQETPVLIAKPTREI